MAIGLYPDFETAFKTAREKDALKQILVDPSALESCREKKAAYGATYAAK